MLVDCFGMITEPYNGGEGSRFDPMIGYREMNQIPQIHSSFEPIGCYILT